MRKTKTFIFILTALISMLTMCAKSNNFPLSVKDDMGREIILEKRPERIVSLSPSNTEILAVLGLQEKIVGTTEYCNCPWVGKKPKKLGGFADINVNEIIKLKPDLVISFGTIQKRFLPEMEKAGLRVFWVYPGTYKDILNLYLRIGRLTGKNIEAMKLKEDVEDKINNITQRISNKSAGKKPGIFRVMGENPVGTIGSLNFQTDIYSLAGAENIYKDIEKDYFEVDIDDLIKRDPDIVLVCGKDEKKIIGKTRSHKDLGRLNAVNNNRILVIDCDIICRPGPHITRSVEQIAEFIYPDRIKKYPGRIISLSPALTENLYILGAGDRLIANTIYCTRPKEAAEKEKIGSLLNFDLEKILQLKPDLIITTELANRKKINILVKSGLNVQTLPPPKNFEELCADFIKLGKIIGKEKAAEEIINNTKKQVSEIINKTNKLPKKRVFMQIGSHPLFAVTGDYFLNDTISFSGGTNIVKHTGNAMYNRESVVSANPEAIIITTMGIVGEEEKKRWEDYRTIDAVKNKKIFIVDSDIFCTPTPVTFLASLKETVVLLHPELKLEK